MKENITLLAFAKDNCQSEEVLKDSVEFLRIMRKTHMRRLREQKTQEDSRGAPVLRVSGVFAADINVRSDAYDIALDSFANTDAFVMYAQIEVHENKNKGGSD